jgi:hypothetical protein
VISAILLEQCFPGTKLSCEALSAQAAITQAASAVVQTNILIWQVALSVATLLAAVVAVIYSKIASQQARMSAVISEEQVRPRISIRFDIERFYFGDDYYLSIGGKFFLKNVGSRLTFVKSLPMVQDWNSVGEQGVPNIRKNIDLVRSWNTGVPISPNQEIARPLLLFEQSGRFEHQFIYPYISIIAVFEGFDKKEHIICETYAVRFGQYLPERGIQQNLAELTVEQIPDLTYEESNFFSHKKKGKKV